MRGDLYERHRRRVFRDLQSLSPEAAKVALGSLVTAFSAKADSGRLGREGFLLAIEEALEAPRKSAATGFGIPCDGPLAEWEKPEGKQ